MAKEETEEEEGEEEEEESSDGSIDSLDAAAMNKRFREMDRGGCRATAIVLSSRETSPLPIKPIQVKVEKESPKPSISLLDIKRERDMRRKALMELQGKNKRMKEEGEPSSRTKRMRLRPQEYWVSSSRK